ncbi:hypothetical protein GCM10015536_62440 [Streptomyces griseomycini]|nr:hypothetical protein GCM10015536_62440 [Streptomyces griseomycini]
MTMAVTPPNWASQGHAALHAEEGAARSPAMCRPGEGRPGPVSGGPKWRRTRGAVRTGPR